MPLFCQQLRLPAAAPVTLAPGNVIRARAAGPSLQLPVPVLQRQNHPCLLLHQTHHQQRSTWPVVAAAAAVLTITVLALALALTLR